MAEKRRTTFWHNCVLHPLCGLAWTFAPRSRLGLWADAVHSRAHVRMDADADG